MGQIERQVGVFVALASLVCGSIVVAVVSPPSSMTGRLVLGVGVFYTGAVGALREFARQASVDVEVMNAAFALLAYVVWWLGTYVIVVRGLSFDRGEFQTVALTFFGIAMTFGAIAVALFGGGVVFGVVEDVSTTIGTAALFGGGFVAYVLVFITAGIHDAEIGWGLEDLSYANAAVEAGAYLLLFVGLGLVAAGLSLDVGAQYLIVSLLGTVVAAISTTVP